MYLLDSSIISRKYRTFIQFLSRCILPDVVAPRFVELLSYIIPLVSLRDSRQPMNRADDENRGGGRFGRKRTRIIRNSIRTAVQILNRVMRNRNNVFRYYAVVASELSRLAPSIVGRRGNAIMINKGALLATLQKRETKLTVHRGTKARTKVWRYIVFHGSGAVTPS